MKIFCRCIDERFLILYMENKKIGFIGAGKVGTGLGDYFSSKGYSVEGYCSRRLQSAQDAAKITKSCIFNDVNQLVNKCDFIFITTPDGQIIKVWNELEQCNIKNKIICHTSGSLSSGIFYNATKLGAYVYSIHPMYAFSDKNGKTSGLENAYFTIEGDNTHLQEIKSFISAMGNKTLIIDTDKKVLYHIANVMASNLILALLSIANDCIRLSGVSEVNSMQALMPLILGNIKNISENGLANSLTGPIERNDSLTIREHLEKLPKQYGGIYVELSLILTQLAGQKHSDGDYTMICQQLNEYLKGIK